MHRPTEDGPSPVLQFSLIWAAVTMQLAVMAQLVYMPGPGDPDDAMRLLELRNYLAGRGWFDLHEPRIAPPLGYDTHWSRLVDGGLALLYHLFEPFVGAAQAELLTRMTWPILCLGVALAAMMAIARQLAGPKGLLASGFIGIFGFQAYYRFLPGRIDHHCVQIMLVMMALYLVLVAEARPRLAAAAGAVTALALAVGLESLPFLAIAAAGLAMQFLRDARQGRALAFYGIGLAAGLAVAYPASVAPARWTGTACDALGFNLAAPLIIAGACLALLVPLLAKRGTLVRALGLALLAALAGGLVILLQPSCLGGPFDMVDAAAHREWLDNVAESMPLFAPGQAFKDLELILPVIFTSIVAACLLLSRQVRGSMPALTVLATFATATLITIGNAKISSYAAWFGMPLLAMAAALVWTHLGITKLWQRAGVAILLAPFTSAALAFGIKIAILTVNPAAQAEEQHWRFCRAEEYRALAALPRGLVLADVDAGPAILLNTAHSVYAAPYHRLAKQIVETIHVFALPAADAETAVLATGANYVVVCRQPKPGRVPPVTLEEVLLAGQPPAWLTPAPVAGDKLLVYRTRLGPP